MAISLNINGKPHSVNSDLDTPLLWVIRDELRLTGTKYGCGIAHCGACTVQLDGAAVRSCQVAVGDVGEASVTTIEGVSGDEAAAVKQAWRELDVVQCGFCQSGRPRHDGPGTTGQSTIGSYITHPRLAYSVAATQLGLVGFAWAVVGGPTAGVTVPNSCN